jgi:hypothetical protein
MSKHSKAKARRRRKHRAKPQTMICQRCAGTAAADADTLLGNLAAALNACAANGIKVKPWHGGILKTCEGYVLPFREGWAARTWTSRPADYAVVPHVDDEED